ncbi:MAG: PilX N-terminal domain-containing pilus assembly protein [Desulfobulbaceae bacterium]
MTTIHNEEGFVLITGLMILLVLTLLGLSATTNTTIELQIAGNDRVHKQTLYEAEAGAIMGAEILEQNFNCPTGFKENPGSVGTLNWVDLEGTLRAFERRTDRNPDNSGEENSIAFWLNEEIDAIDNPEGVYIGDPNQADVAYPIANLDPNGDGNPADDREQTGYIYIAGQTVMLPGGALQMAAGYEGKGKGAGGGGVAKITDIYSHFRGALNSESIIQFGWRHLIGMEGDCIY